jgi:MFS family permease
LWASMTGVGQIVGSAIAGPVSQRVGRRWTAMGSGVITVRRS